MEDNILFIDVETTGLIRPWDAYPQQLWAYPEIVQIAWILTDKDGNELEKKCQIVRGETPSSEEALGIHGITKRIRTMEGVSPYDCLTILNEIINEASLIVCHNIEFDCRVIAAEMLRHGIDSQILNMKKYCTMKIGAHYMKQKKWPTLSALHFHLFGYNFENAHNALSDIMATKDCYFRMKQLPDPLK